MFWFCYRIHRKSMLDTFQRNGFWRFSYVLVHSIHNSNLRRSSVFEQRFDHDLNTLTSLMTADLHIQDRADLRVSKNPPSHLGFFFTSRNVYSGQKFFIWSGPSSSSSVMKLCRMSAFSKVKHHVLSSSVPLSVWFVRMGSIQFLLGSWSQKWPTSWRELASIICNFDRIRSAIVFVSSFSPYNVVVRWHEDDPTFELLKFTLWFRHHLLNLVEKTQCSEFWEIVHSNSICSPSMRSKSLR